LSSPNLHVGINAGLFIDRDPVTGLLISQGPHSHDSTFSKIKRDGYPESSVRLPRSIDQLGDITHRRCGDCFGAIDRLDLSVANGLDKPSGLRSLTYFGVANLETKLGVKDVQWMAEHWLGLHQLHSADDSIADEATKWLGMHHLHIRVVGSLR
jgi:hypothetical protein